MAIFRAKNTLLRKEAEVFFEILFSLKGPFWVKNSRHCYYSRLAWPTSNQHASNLLLKTGLIVTKNKISVIQLSLRYWQGI